MASYVGIVKARIIEVRFAISGKIIKVERYQGSRVSKGELIAALDRKIMQTELERQLSDFERIRADFEIFNQKNPNPQSEIDRYLKAEKQAELNASVKDVELAKAKLDQNDLFSPVEGIVLDDGGIVPGLYITPSNSPLKIADCSTHYFELPIEEKDIKNFLTPNDCLLKFNALDKEVSSTSSPAAYNGKQFFVKIPIPCADWLMMGMTANVEF